MATIIAHGKGYRVQIRRQGHDSISKSGFNSKAEARVWARAAEAAMDAGKKVEVGKAQFATILAEYRRATASKVQSRSKRASLAMLEHRLGAARLADLTAKRLIKFVAEREAEGAGPSHDHDGYVLHRHRLALRVRRARSRSVASPGGPDQCPGHPESCRTGSAAVAERDRRPTEAELLALMSFWRRRPCREIMMPDVTVFGVATGMRLGEILRLSWAELNETKRTIWVRDRKHPRQKRGNDQEVPLVRGPFVLAGKVIDPLEIIKRQERRGKLIFPYRPASTSSAFARAVQACGIDDLHFHDLGTMRARSCLKPAIGSNRWLW